jgi:hypothetical protein
MWIEYQMYDSSFRKQREIQANLSPREVESKSYCGMDYADVILRTSQVQSRLHVERCANVRSGNSACPISCVTFVAKSFLSSSHVNIQSDVQVRSVQGGLTIEGFGKLKNVTFVSRIWVRYSKPQGVFDCNELLRIAATRMSS